MNTLSVVLAVLNEQENIGACLESVKEIADEIVIVDEHSTDDTVKIARNYGAKIYEEPHHEIFHITKQKAIEKATGDWILQLDADERVTPNLAKEIKDVIDLSGSDLKKLQVERLKNKLFIRHQQLIEQRDGPIGDKSLPVSAFFVSRVNYFLGKPLLHAGVYPDGVIRLIKNGHARFPAKSVHEQISVDGDVSWLLNSLEHHDSPTLSKYFKRMNRYTDLQAEELNAAQTSKTVLAFVFYSLLKPLLIFFKLYLRHKGILDGARGFLWSFFSSLHYPIAYYKYLIQKK